MSGIVRAVGIRPNGASVLVDLTDQGRELAGVLTLKAADRLRLALADFSGGERDQLVAMLKQLSAA